MIMPCVSVIIQNNHKSNISCLKSVLNQSLKNIEIICFYDETNYSILNEFSKLDNRIKLISSNEHLDHVCGEYVFQVRTVISKEICGILYNQSKSQDLDVLYVSNYDFFIENNDKYEDRIITPINFTPFFKNDFFNEYFENMCLDCNNVGFCNESLYSEDDLDLEYVSEIIHNTFNFNEKSKDNQLFSILIEYLSNLSLNNRQSIYDLIKENFKNRNLSDKNKLVFDLISKNNFYLDFLTDFNLEIVDYEVYDNPADMENYKISVVIPIYNNETLIHRTLMSIENQSIGLDNIEVLMINDASTDNTSTVINEYVDKYPNFKAIHIKEGTGSAGTPRNIGLKLASADYVIFIDHDDFFEISALEKLYDAIVENKCDFVYGTYALIDSEKPIKFIYPNEKHGLFKNLEDNIRSITTPPSIWTKLFKKEFLLKNNILFPTILGEDAIFVSKSLKNADGVYYLWDDIICYYNLNENSFSSNLSYDYFVEGFTSEEYLFELYSSWNHKDYYELRGQGIIDFYINRFNYSNLNDNEIERIFPLFYEFCYRLYLLNISPKQDKNKIIFDYVIRKDVEGLIKFKNYKPSTFKRFSKKILNKINKHGFW